MNNLKTFDAYMLAAQKHSGQQRKDGREYLIHPQGTAENILKFKPQSKNLIDLVNAAWLHDSLEDTDLTYDEIKDQFGELTANIVQEVTSDKEKINQQGKTEYLKDKILNMSSYGLIVKLADRYDNICDLQNVSETFRQKTIDSTIELINHLEDNRELTATHKKLVEAIKEEIQKMI